MRGIFSVLVENRSGVLSKTAGLFARRGYNIDSLAVGETENPGNFKYDDCLYRRLQSH